MAKLILKSPYIKSTGGASGYLKYIATRERVEIIPDDRPPTRKQEQLITKLVKDFPEVKELYEYGDYMDKPTKANASAFITLALESNWDSVMQSERYMKYIATRPRAERLGEHGLFGDSDGIDLDAAMNELENYAGNVWTHIISLKRKDAARLGFDNAAAWRDLLRAHRNDIAAAMKIPSNDFRWYAAFHDEGEHPHVHMMAWSAKPGQAYLSKDGIRQIKSTLTNHIFQNEMLHLYEQKSVSRDELVRDARKAMLEMVQSMKEGIQNPSENPPAKHPCPFGRSQSITRCRATAPPPYTQNIFSSSVPPCFSIRFSVGRSKTPFRGSYPPRSDFIHLLHTVHTHDTHAFCCPHAVAAARTYQLSCAAGSAFTASVRSPRVARSRSPYTNARNNAASSDADFIPAF